MSAAARGDTSGWAFALLETSRLREANDELESLLEHGDAEVRWHALRALQRIDADRAASLIRVKALRHDPDPRVATLATKLTQ